MASPLLASHPGHQLLATHHSFGNPPSAIFHSHLPRRLQPTHPTFPTRRLAPLRPDGARWAAARPCPRTLTSAVNNVISAMSVAILYSTLFILRSLLPLPKAKLPAPKVVTSAPKPGLSAPNVGLSAPTPALPRRSATPIRLTTGFYPPPSITLGTTRIAGLRSAATQSLSRRPERPQSSSQISDFHHSPLATRLHSHGRPFVFFVPFCKTLSAWSLAPMSAFHPRPTLRPPSLPPVNSFPPPPLSTSPREPVDSREKDTEGF